MGLLGEWNRVILSGGLGPQEVWSTGCSFADVTGGTSNGVSSLTNLQTAANAILTDINNSGSLQGPFNRVSLAGNVARVRVEARDGSGLIQAAEAVPTLPIPGTGTSVMPSVCCSVVSLLTGIPGRRMRGRMYVPYLNAGASSFRITSSEVSSILSQTKTRLNNWAAALTATGEGTSVPVVVSEAGSLCTPVQQLRVGDVPDTQRRRRDSLIEVYSSVAL